MCGLACVEDALLLEKIALQRGRVTADLRGAILWTLRRFAPTLAAAKCPTAIAQQTHRIAILNVIHNGHARFSTCCLRPYYSS